MAKISTLVDAFPGTTLNATNWYVEPVNGGANNGLPSGTATVSGGQLSLSGGIDSGTGYYTSINSQSAYDLTSSAVFCKVIPNTSSTDYDTGFDLVNQAVTSGIAFGVTLGNLYIQENNAGTFSTPYSTAYNATSHAWLKISESGGIITFSTSPTGAAGSWTALPYTAMPETINTWTAATSYIQMYYGSNSGAAKPSGTGSFQDFNVAPATTTTSRLLMVGIV